MKIDLMDELYSYYNNLGIEYLHKEDYKKALENFDRLIELNPQSASAYQNRCIALTGLKRFEEALEIINLIIDAFPSDPDPKWFLIRAAIHEGQQEFVKALKDYELVEKLIPMEISVIVGMCSVLIKLNLLDLALQRVNSAISENPASYLLYDKRAEIMFHLHCYEESINNHTAALEIYPNCLSYSNRGISYNYNGEFRKAIPSFEKALEIDKNFPNAYFGLAKAYTELGNFTKALENISYAIVLDPSDDNYQTRGGIYMSKHDYPSAIDDFTTATRVNPQHYVSYVNRAISYLQLEQFQNALDDIGICLKIDPNQGSAYRARGYYHIIKGNDGAAFADFQTYLYHAINEQKVYGIGRLIDMFKDSPKTIHTIWESFHINVNDLLLNPFENILNKLSDFNTFTGFVEFTQTLTERQLLSLHAVLNFHLGGSVSAFKIYDEQLDDSENPMSAQDFYYYARASAEIDIEKDSVIRNCINDLSATAKTSTDFYYFGQIHRLAGQNDEAIECFSKSKDFPYSVLMLAFLSGDADCLDQVNEKFKNKTFHTDFNILKADLSGFYDYFHINESLQALHFFAIEKKLLFDWSCYNLPMWEVFRLNDTQKEDLSEYLRRKEAERIIGVLRDEFKLALESKSVADNAEQLKNLSSRLGLKSHQDISDIYYNLRYRIDSDGHAEEQIATIIDGWKIDKPSVYLYMIKYFYLIEETNAEETFNLFMYWIYKFTTKRDARKNMAVRSSLTSLGENLPWIKETFSVMKIILPLVNELSERYEFELSDVSDYDIFKDELWRIIIYDKNNLSDEDFTKKYAMFKWFDTYKFA